MPNNKTIANLISMKRNNIGLSQQQLAQKLDLPVHEILDLENGISHLNESQIYQLSQILNLTTDEILLFQSSLSHAISYSKAGVDISYTDSIKKEMATLLHSKNPRVLNGVGPFASLYDIHFSEYKRPVLVLKSEEPGSKQKLAMEYGHIESICHDLINHLVNDIVVMGAKPLAVLDTIICGKADKRIISTLIKELSAACKKNECVLVGGETSVQPHILEDNLYILTSSIVGIVEHTNIIDGSSIVENDIILAICSNGLHTNGYSLVRLLLETNPQIAFQKVDNLTFIEQILKPHTPYYSVIKDLFATNYLHGMAHITGGGIAGNISRVVPDGLCANIDLSQLRTLPIFRFIKQQGNITDHEMLQTFNCGVGFILIVSPNSAKKVIQHISKQLLCYPIGTIKKGREKVRFTKSINW